MSHMHEDEKQSQKWMETLLRYIYSKDSSGAVPDLLFLSPGSYHLLSPLPPFSPFLPPTWLCSEKLICVDHAKGFPVFWLPVVPVQRGVPADQRRGMNEVQHSSPWFPAARLTGSLYPSMSHSSSQDMASTHSFW